MSKMVYQQGPSEGGHPTHSGGARTPVGPELGPPKGEKEEVKKKKRKKDRGNERKVGKKGENREKYGLLNKTNQD